MLFNNNDDKSDDSNEDGAHDVAHVCQVLGLSFVVCLLFIVRCSFVGYCCLLVAYYSWFVVIVIVIVFIVLIVIVIVVIVVVVVIVIVIVACLLPEQREVSLQFESQLLMFDRVCPLVTQLILKLYMGNFHREFCRYVPREDLPSA